MRQGRTLCNNQKINSRMRYNVYVCVCVYTYIPQYIRQMLTFIKGEIYSNTVMVGDFHTLLKPMNSASREN